MFYNYNCITRSLSPFLLSLLGDTLLMVGKPTLVDNHKSDFVLVSQVGNNPLKSDPFHLILAPLLMVVMVALSSADVTPLLTAALCTMFVNYIYYLYLLIIDTSRHSFSFIYTPTSTYPHTSNPFS